MDELTQQGRARVWVVSELFYPEHTSTGRFLTGIAEELGKGYDVNVLCAQPTYRARGTKAPNRERRNGISIQRCWATRFDRSSLPLRIMNVLTISASLTLSLLRQVKERDIVFVVTNPPLLPFLVVVISLVAKARSVVIVHDVYPEVLSASGFLGTDRISWRIAARATAWLYNAATRVIVIGRDMWDLAARKTRDPSARLLLIPNWGDTDEIRPRPFAANRLRELPGIKGRFVVQYLGNIGRTHAIEDLVTVARKFRNDTSTAFLFVGSGAKRSLISDAMMSDSLPNVTLLDACEESELSEYLAAADVAVIAMMSGMTGVSVPSRMYNVMASGTPIIAITDRSSELGQVVAENAIGWIVEPGNVTGLCEVIRRAQADRDALAEMGIRAREAVLRSYTREKVGESFRSLARELIDK